MYRGECFENKIPKFYEKSLAFFYDFYFFDNLRLQQRALEITTMYVQMELLVLQLKECLS